MNNLDLRVLCSIKEKENVRGNKRVNGLPVDKVQRAGSVSGSDSEGELSQERWSGEVGFDWDWPRWKNVPQRYKLIESGEVGFDWNWRRHFPIRRNRPYCQDNTFGRAFTGCSICLWWSECRKCCRVSSGSSPYPKSGLGICILHIFLFGYCVGPNQQM